MLSGVSVLCFAASYAVALALEVSRLLFHSGVRGAIMLGFAGAGLVAHTAFLYYRAVSEIGSPLSSEKDWFLVAAWVLVVVYLLLAALHPKAPFGLFLLPLALALIGAARFLAQDVPLAREPASQVWGAIHGVSIMLATVSVLVGFVAGLMYLGQVRRLKHKRPPTGRGPRLPSLEWLQWANARAILASTLFLGLGVLSGMVLNLINIHRDGWRVPWSDPVILSTWLMFFWLLAAVITSAVYRPARQGRKVAYLTLVSFVFLAIMLAVGLLMDSRHWGRGERGEGRGERSRGEVRSGFCYGKPGSVILSEPKDLKTARFSASLRMTWHEDRSPQQKRSTEYRAHSAAPSPFPLLPSVRRSSPGGRAC
jgi:ABC-type transport system involved in cytochrome c biogenesis permease subunit